MCSRIWHALHACEATQNDNLHLPALWKWNTPTWPRKHVEHLTCVHNVAEFQQTVSDPCSALPSPVQNSNGSEKSSRMHVFFDSMSMAGKVTPHGRTVSHYTFNNTHDPSTLATTHMYSIPRHTLTQSVASSLAVRVRSLALMFVSTFLRSRYATNSSTSNHGRCCTATPTQPTMLSWSNDSTASD